MKRPKGAPPEAAERPPGHPRRFRKTAEELALVFQTRLKAQGMDVPLAEVVAIIRGQTGHDPVSVIVKPWADAERGRGVLIV